MVTYRIRWTLVLVFILLVILGGRAHCQSSNEDAAVRRVDGYQGIWFTLGQFYGKGDGEQAYAQVSRTPVFPYGDKYSGGLGTYTAKHTPLAIYCEEANKTFFVFGGTRGPKQRHLLCMISYFDHQSRQVPRPVVVHDKHGVDDPHDNPSLAVDDAGHLWVFISGRGTTRPGWKYRSKKPFSIDGFELISQEEMTYPQPHVLPDGQFLHLFTKYSGVRELYFERSADGRNWSADKQLAGIRESGDRHGGHYQTSARHENRIGTFFNRHPQGNVDRRTDVYYAETADGGETWTNVHGEPFELPARTVDHPTRVIDYASQGLNVYLKDMGFDAGGRPVLLYVTSKGHQPGPPNGPREFRMTRWDGQQWRTSTICPTDHNYDMGSLAVKSRRWLAWIPSTAGPQPDHGGGEIERWESLDQGETWQKHQSLTRGSERNHNYVRRVLNGRDPFAIFWADGDPTKLSESRLYFSDRLGQHVWQLPYRMNAETVSPQEMKFSTEKATR